MSYSPEQIEACILAYRNGDLNYCRAGIIDLLTAYAANLRQSADSGRVGDEVRGLVTLWRQREHSSEEVTEFDKGYEQASDECAEALEAALAAQGQGEFSALSGACKIVGPKEDVLHILKIIGEPDDHPTPASSPAGVPDGDDYTTDEVGEVMALLWRHRSSVPDDCLRQMEARLLSAAAPSAPEGDGGEG